MINLKAVVTILVLTALCVGLFKTNTVNQYLPSHTVRKHSPTPLPERIESDELFNLVQEWRVKNNLDTYVEHNELCLFAAVRVLEIETEFSHDGFDPYVKNLSNPQFSKYAENLSEGYKKENLLLESWLNSPLHAKNLYSDFKYSCIRTDGNKTVHIFGNM